MRKNLFSFVLLLLAVLLLGIVSEQLYWRYDLTSDKRYTLSKPAKEIMNKLDDVVFIRVYLDGEMPVTLKKFQHSVKETLEELQRVAGKHLNYEFRNPSEGNDHQRNTLFEELHRKGLQPFPIRENDAEGGATERLLFPGAIVNYKGRELSVNLIQNNPILSPEENINFALQNLEYEFVNTIQKISRTTKDKIAFIEGHGELDDYAVGDISRELLEYYEVERVVLGSDPGLLDKYKAVIVAKPLEKWSEADKFTLDQYIMNGGNTAWFIDAVYIHEDSLSRGELTFGMICEHNLNDQLFQYGVRVNPNVLQDLQCGAMQVNIAPAGMPADFRLSPWTYFPLLSPPENQAITKGLNLIRSQYPGVIDTVGRNAAVKKKFLLYSSDKAMVTDAPLLISLSQINEKITQRNFNRSHLPVAVLLEGVFESPFRHRSVNQYALPANRTFKGQSEPAKMIVVSDGDIIRNEVSRRADRTSIFPLGYDRHTNITYGNKEFVKNCINYLTDDSNLMEIRNRTFQLRLLDKSKMVNNRTSIVLMNTVAPLVLVIAAGMLFVWLRKRRYNLKL